jgi:MYXO-CTERM domain-containing protein
LLGLAACGEPLDSTTANIVGGSVDLDDPGVAALERCINDVCTVCTATLISREVLLTAAHCVDQNLPDDVGGLFGYFGTNVANPGTRIVADDALMHRYYDADSLAFDIALVHLSEPAPDIIPIVTLNEAPLDASLVDQPIRLVGYGETEFDRNDFGVKHEVSTVITTVAPRHVFTGTDTENTCKGDSGGPCFYDDGSGEVQIGITSRSQACTAGSVKTRVDVFIDELIVPYIDRFEGACPFDGTCTTSGCRSPDPDCDPCLLDGVCATGCSAPDWDCPIGLAVGASCGADEACEFLDCQVAVDDDRIRYCSRPCDPDNPGLDCLSGMDCRDQGNGPQCLWPAPTPGVLGSACGLPADCRSNLCEDMICVERCDEVPDGICPAEFECRDSDLGGQVCGPRLAETGGCGCKTTGSGGAAPLLIVVALLSLRRRRCADIA